MAVRGPCYVMNMIDTAPEFENGTLSLNEVLERYATLRDTITSLNDEKERLGEVIKAALTRGEKPESELYTAEFKIQRRVEYPIERFREVFGDTATLEVASIDKKKAEALAQAGDLDADKLRAIAQVRPVQALVLIAKGRD